MTPIARLAAELHNTADQLAKATRRMAHIIQEMEEELEAYRKEQPK